MHNEQSQIIVIIIAGTAVLLFIGILFLVLIWAYNNKRQQLERDKLQIRADFEQQLLQSSLEIQEDTFNVISQEIHDNVCQMLSLARVQLNLLAQSEAAGGPSLADVKESIGTALTDLRGLAKSLSSERIYARSLPESICEEVARLQKTGLPIRFEITGEEKDIENKVKLILFRIIQEALQNILKHARAAEVHIQFHYGPEELHIAVKDNGVGFDADSTKADGLGLRNIVTRTALIGGHAHIASRPGTGTHVILNIPLCPIPTTSLS